MTEPHRLPDRRMIALNPPAAWSDSAAAAPPSAARDADEPVVRPFLMTGGRTTPLIDGLRLETLVHAPPAALSAPLRFEQSTVVRLCQRPHSVAEIAAALRVPVGVARVVVSDLVAAGHVSTHTADELSTAAIERIRDLVRAL
ncbi:DUF742 domain-containing protein [Nocardia blacklockiae]|uniref:DUF742 domain-containing protein n=1 Tax=Nocardia blacklockiae TaxID=480036 RepID=UPI0018946070|nr:DUF742 domain-containing protein [Nocardia blacklockiae]MBF6172012.1 DUF742 domain-containing protein [Nocardia blacklockiae]